jgi:hypothetical protein
MHEVLATGDISALQAHRIVRAEGERFSVWQLVMEDIAAMYPPAPLIDPVIVSRNLRSIGWEQGLYPAEIARKTGISLGSAVAYAQGSSRRINRELLIKAAQGLGIGLAELADPSRPELKVTPFFKTNLEHLVSSSGMAPTPLGEACGLELRALRTLLSGTDPNPHQVAKLVRFFRVSPRDLLMKDLRGFRSAPEETQAQDREQQTAPKSDVNTDAEDLSAKSANFPKQFTVHLNGATAHGGIDVASRDAEINQRENHGAE